MAGVLVLAACGSDSAPGAAPEPQGPPAVQTGVVDDHAAQFDDALADRPAGSQREFAASTYILGHLQTAGYAPLLDPVPVEDTVRSTNVVAQPPFGGEPQVVVTVAYDTRPEQDDGGESIGVWLELARALYARDREHAVEFVALGAEQTRLNGGNLGSRRLVEFLRGDELSPLVISLEDVSRGSSPLLVRGDDADALVAIADRLKIDSGPLVSAGAAEAVFERAGMRQASVEGGADSVARVILEFLAPQEGASSSPS